MGRMMMTMSGIRLRLRGPRTVAGKVALLELGGLLVLCGLTLGLGYGVLSGALERQAVTTQTLSMLVAHAALDKLGHEIHLDGERLMVDGVVLDGNEALVDEIQRATGGTATVFRGDLRVATNVRRPDGTRAVGTRLVGPAHDMVLGAGKPFRGQVDILGEPYYAAYDPLVDAEGKTVGVLYVGLKRADMLAGLILGVSEVAIGITLLVALTALVFSVLTGRLLKPLKGLRRSMDAMRAGNFTEVVSHTDRRDDLGDMARSLHVFHGGLQETEALRRAQEIDRAEAEQARLAALEGMAETVEREARAAVDEVTGHSSAMGAKAQTMMEAADRVGHNAQSVAAAAGQALANAQAVAAATDQLTASIQEISAQVNYASSVSRRTVEDSGEAASAIAALSESVEQIGGIATLIATIARQTNLLALNATIEAARAGAAGKGFAVVAGEVKALAGQTADATQGITRRVQEIAAVRDRAVSAVGHITGRIQQIDEAASSIAAAMEEQSAATSEIARNVSQTTRAAQEVAERIAQVSVEAVETDRCAEEVRETAKTVSESVDQLRSTLIRVVRTATKDVDRRRKPRYRIDRSCDVEDRTGHRVRGRVLSISEGGAMVQASLDLPPGAPGTLSLGGVLVDFVSKGRTPVGTHVKFAEIPGKQSRLMEIVGSSAAEMIEEMA